MEIEKQKEHFSEEKGRILLELARKTIADRLKIHYDSEIDLESIFRDDTLLVPRGTFVTLKLNNQLRGCIGNLNPDKPLADGIRANAVNAAFHDPRFAPLSPEEFKKVQIEISLLTEPEPLEYKGANDLLSKIVPDVDGLIIRKGIHSSTFLPQVWEQLPDKQMFLQNLCLKAGLPANEWKKGDLFVHTYRVQYFEEPH